MALNRVPWFLSTPGVEHSSDDARRLAHAATNGATGVTTPDALKVTAQPVPDNTVRVSRGAAVAASPFEGHDDQSYIMSNISSTDVTIAPTGSSGGRSDAIVIRVDDPGLTGQVPPQDRLQEYEYTRLEVVEGVSSGLEYWGDLTLPYPAVVLARIDIPAATGTITNAMITDLREVANPREKTVTRPYGTLRSDGIQTLTTQIAYPQGEYFPRIGGTDNGSIHTIRVPEWATFMEVRAEWLSVAVDKYSGNGHMWVTWDTVIRNSPAYWSQAYRWSSEDTTQRQNWVVADTASIPASLRGRDVHFALRANRDASQDASGRARMDIPSGMTLSVRFMETAN